MRYLISLIVLLMLTAVSAQAQRPPAPGDVISVADGAFINQIGDYNQAGITQTGDPSHEGEIYQDGDDNGAELKQAGSGHSGIISQVGNNNTGVIIVTGLNHTSVIVQHGDGHNTQSTIIGEENTVDIRQFGTSAHTVGFDGDLISTVKQDGDFNSFFSVQIGDLGGHLITTADGGDYIQKGDGNLIDVWQEGDTHTARLLQDGNRNTIGLMQTGSMQSATISQSGSGNMATVNQSN